MERDINHFQRYLMLLIHAELFCLELNISKRVILPTFLIEPIQSILFCSVLFER